MAHGPVAVASHPQAASKGDTGSVCRGLECTICYDAPHNPVVTFCGHLFCWDCLSEWVKLHSSKKQCPVCKSHLSKVVRILGQDGGNVASHFEYDEHESHDDACVNSDSMGPAQTSLPASLVRENVERNLNVNSESRNPELAPSQSEGRFPSQNQGDNFSSAHRVYHDHLNVVQLARPHRTQSHTVALSTPGSPLTLSPQHSSASASSSPSQHTSRPVVLDASRAPHRHSSRPRTVLREPRVLGTIGRWWHHAAGGR